MPENPYEAPTVPNERGDDNRWKNRAWFAFWLIIGLGLISLYGFLFLTPIVRLLLGPEE